jgi:hypothetical protein
VLVKSKATINDAVERCLCQCYQTAVPLSTLAEFVEKLRKEGWDRPDIHQVEMTVLKVLLALSNEQQASAAARPLARASSAPPAHLDASSATSAPSATLNG